MGALLLEAIGPATVHTAQLAEPLPLKVGGKPYGRPFYGCRLAFPPGPALTRLHEVISEALSARWPTGTPQQFFHPVMPGDQVGLDAALQTIWCRAPADRPPQLFDARDPQQIVPLAHRAAVAAGCTVLATIELEAAQPVPWAGSVDLTLIALALVGEAEQTQTAAAFAAALAA
jgi:hypothetical protein